MKAFASRNIKVYFRDRAAVLYSLLGVLIVVGLYTVFLGDNLTSGLGSLQNGKLLVNGWLVAGICAITPVTTSMGALGSLVDDRSRKVSKDFMASPVRRYQLVLGYLAGGIVAATMMSLVVLVLGGGYLAASGMALPAPLTLLAIAGVQLLGILSGASMTFLLVSFFQTASVYSAASTVVGTVIGFLTGIYLPVGLLPEGVQWAVRIFPTTHVAALMRYLLLNGSSDKFFAGMPPQVQTEVWNELGVRIAIGDTLVPLWGSVVYVLAFIAIFFGLSVVVMSRKK